MSGKTTRTGTFSLMTKIRPATTIYRAYAKAVTISGRRLKAAATANRTITTRAQSGSLTLPTTSQVGGTVTVVAKFTPARTGRPVTLQRWSGTAWGAVGSKTQTGTGAATFSLPTPSGGSFRYRAVAGSYKGAAAVATPTRTITVAAASAATWSPRTILMDPHQSGSVRDASCASQTFCMAIGENFTDDVAVVATFDGTSWSPGPVPEFYPRHVECVTSTWCMAIGNEPVDYDLTAAVFNGTEWTALSQTFNGAKDLSCSAVGSCVVLGYGTAYVMNGATWTLFHQWDDESDPREVSCASPTFCVATTFAGPYVYDGTTWSAAPAPPNGTELLTSISCVSPTYCLASTLTGGPNYNGAVSTFNGTTWSVPTVLLPYRAEDYETGRVNGISCVSTTDCMAIGYYVGNDAVSTRAAGIARFDGQWGTPAPLFTAIYDDLRPIAVDCVTATFCIAADNQGGVRIYD